MNDMKSIYKRDIDISTDIAQAKTKQKIYAEINNMEPIIWNTRNRSGFLRLSYFLFSSSEEMLY